MAALQVPKVPQVKLMNFDYTYNSIETALRESNRIEFEGEDALQDSLTAWYFLMEFDGLTVKNVLHAHKLLMETRTSIDDSDKGCFTKHQTSVGGRMNPDPYKVPALMDAWIEKYGHGVTSGEAKAAHVAFEKVHPFCDGNGRVGRLIYYWHLAKAGALLNIITYAERKRYYDWFKD